MIVVIVNPRRLRLVIGKLTLLVFDVVFTIVFYLATRLVARLNSGIVAVVVSGVVARGGVLSGLLEGIFGGRVVLRLTTQVAFVIVHLNIILLLRDFAIMQREKARMRSLNSV